MGFSCGEGGYSVYACEAGGCGCEIVCRVVAVCWLGNAARSKEALIWCLAGWELVLDALLKRSSLFLNSQVLLLRVNPFSRLHNLVWWYSSISLGRP